MLTLRVSDKIITLIEDIKLENKSYEEKLSSSSDFMHDYYERVIKLNEELIDDYSNLGIEILETEEEA